LIWIIDCGNLQVNVPRIAQIHHGLHSCVNLIDIYASIGYVW